MRDRAGSRALLVPILLSLACACANDSLSGDSLGLSSTDDDTSSSASGPGEGAGGEADGASGDGDGDGGPGDGDGSPGDGDGDGEPGDGDGSPGDGDADGPGDGPGDDGDGPGDDGGDDGDDGEACEESNGVLYPVPPSVMFLLDRSGSMNLQGFDADVPEKSRWQALYESVESVVGDGADATIAFGAKTFSTWNFGECGVSNGPDVPIALNNGAGVLAGIPGPLAYIIGGTPTNLAIKKTLAIMQNFDAGGGSKIVFLITDGAIGCTNNHQQALAEAVTDLDSGFVNDDITTYVVGIAPANSNLVFTQLHQMAIAGGAPKPGPEAFYRADDAQQLSDALAAVLADSYGKSCVMDLQDAPMLPELVKVMIGDTQYPLVDDCDNQDGFVYTDPDYTQIRVCGAACEGLALEQSAVVQFFCVPG